ALFATATACAGFASLVTGHITLTRDLGITMSVGVGIAFVVAVVLVPTVLSMLGPPSERALLPWRGGAASRGLSYVVEVGRRSSVTVGVTAIVIFLASVAGARWVAVDQYATRERPPDHPTRIATVRVDQTLMGAFQTQVGVRAGDGGSLERPRLLAAVAALQDFLTEQTHVVKTWSIVDYLKELDAVARDGTERRLPESEDLVSQYLLLLSSGGRTSDVGMLIDPTH